MWAVWYDACLGWLALLSMVISGSTSCFSGPASAPRRTGHTVGGHQVFAGCTWGTSELGIGVTLSWLQTLSWISGGGNQGSLTQGRFSKSWFIPFFFFNIYLASLGLNCSMQGLLVVEGELLIAVCGDLVPWPGINPWPFVLGACSIGHWTTREVPKSALFNLLHYCHIFMSIKISCSNLKYNLRILYLRI